MPVRVDTRQIQQRDYGTMICKATRITSVRPNHQPSSILRRQGHALVSKFLRRLLKSDNSGEVIRIMFSLITIILANSRSYSSALLLLGKIAETLTSSFSRISAIVLKILSAFKCKHNCRIIKLPLVSNNRRSVLNSSKTLTMKLVKYASSDEADI
jgi:hypothetical protein